MTAHALVHAVLRVLLDDGRVVAVADTAGDLDGERRVRVRRRRDGGRDAHVRVAARRSRGRALRGLRRRRCRPRRRRHRTRLRRAVEPQDARGSQEQRDDDGAAYQEQLHVRPLPVDERGQAPRADPLAATFLPHREQWRVVLVGAAAEALDWQPCFKGRRRQGSFCCARRGHLATSYHDVIKTLDVSVAKSLGAEAGALKEAVI